MCALVRNIMKQSVILLVSLVWLCWGRPQEKPSTGFEIEYQLFKPTPVEKPKNHPMPMISDQLLADKKPQNLTTSPATAENKYGNSSDGVKPSVHESDEIAFSSMEDIEGEVATTSDVTTTTEEEPVIFGIQSIPQEGNVVIAVDLEGIRGGPPGAIGAAPAPALNTDISSAAIASLSGGGIG